MGLTSNSTGMCVVDSGLKINKTSPTDKVIALAGNPNVGKSTVFNNLTGLNQHTGNWPGKTVTNAAGHCIFRDTTYILVDIPGTYSLLAHSAEEEVARDFICFGEPDRVVVVCDATCLERNLNLVLQTIEITNNVVVCVNLMDEAKRKGIQINLKSLSAKLGVPVVGTVARKKRSLDNLMEALSGTNNKETIKINYLPPIEKAIEIVQVAVKQKVQKINSRWLSLRLIESDKSLLKTLKEYLGYDILADEEITQKIDEAAIYLQEQGITKENLQDKIVSSIVSAAEQIAKEVVTCEKDNYDAVDRKVDRVLTSKWIGFPIMLVLLMFIFWLTISGANIPSSVLSDGLFWIEDKLTKFFLYINAPSWLHGALVSGVYRVLAWVVAVMLPPMAIFFPLFTLLEDLGYLPRVAFNLDKYFKKCSACGKQALTMCMGFGCNAAGIVGCRIIDSPRERLIAIITNNFVPCNGRFPTLISILTMFFIGVAAGPFKSVYSALLLTCVIVFGIIMTLLVSKLLSRTILKGVPSSFTLELPPYRRPQIGKVIVRSIFDRTLFVLGRAVVVAAPAGLIIWLAANITVRDATILSRCAQFLDPFAKLMGLDGVILIAFILGFPANEIVVPIMIMAYMSTGSLIELDSLAELKQLLISNGWTATTAISMMLFSLMHWPCSTTCLTIKKETGSLKWTAVSFLIPTAMGIIICIAINFAAKLFI